MQKINNIFNNNYLNRRISGDYGIRCEYYNIFIDSDFDCNECERNKLCTKKKK